MAKIKTTRGKKVMTVLAIILGIIVGLNIIGFAINKIFFSNELEAVSPYGQLVEVNGRKMHVYSMGNGEKTIVLLPGFGVSLPSADFGPLMRELSKEYTVVCIEYFGIGFSGQTDTPRTNENYTEETRTALSLAGFKAPYVLMPHSASGIYSEYYAAKYPDEVSAIIMLDTTSTVKTGAKNPPKFLYGLGKLQQACGLTRIAYGLMPPAQKAENGYTEKEISDYKLFANHVLNDTIIDQSYRMLDNINEVNAIAFPQEIPVLKLISSQTSQKAGAEYQTDHLNRLGANAESKIMDGSHFIYQTNVTEIYDATSTFLKQPSL
ncbi:alpha/beta fold hydrolase [Pelotomaculum propionicicum]|uniref:alpha/beta fold hydrolase n=1 Tax=Pelotomaculum propionicicum TaxID=258475 RepID=UPI003B8073F7